MGFIETFFTVLAADLVVVGILLYAKHRRR